MVPPNDDEHGCAWREFATHLQGEVESLKAKLAVLERAAFDKRSERKKMPPDETRQLRRELAALRAERVETVERLEPVPESDKKCRLCGGTTFRPFGEGKSCTIYEYVPGYFRRRIVRRETVACRCGGCVLTAPAPARWSDKTRYASSFVAHLVVSKCLAAMPHYRLEQDFARRGMPVPRSTMNDLFRRCGRKLMPLDSPLFEVITSDPVVYADETGFRMTAQKSKAFIWAFVGAQLTGYRFELTRGGDVPLEVFGESEGALVCDDYRGYDPITRLGKRQRLGCLTHGRRKFFEAGSVPEANEAMELVAGIYRVEHEAERLGIFGSPEHLALRRCYARPLFLRLVLLARELRRTHGPKTLLGRAARYFWRNQRTLGRFLKNAAVRPDNNLAENALRLIALGRKNFLFVHSEEAGKELALFTRSSSPVRAWGSTPSSI